MSYKSVCMLSLLSEKKNLNKKCRRQEASVERKRREKFMSSAIVPSVCRLHASEIFSIHQMLHTGCHVVNFEMQLFYGMQACSSRTIPVNRRKLNLN